MTCKSYGRLTERLARWAPPHHRTFFVISISPFSRIIIILLCSVAVVGTGLLGGSDDDRCRDSDDFGIAELTRAAATETVTPPDCVPFRFSFPSFPLDSVQQQELLLNRNRQQQQKDETPPSLSSSGPLSPPPFFLLVSSPPCVLFHHLLPADGPGGARLSSCSSH